MVRVDKEMKNERMLEVLIVVLIIPLVSLLAGYFISKDIVEPNISKQMTVIILKRWLLKELTCLKLF